MDGWVRLSDPAYGTLIVEFIGDEVKWRLNAGEWHIEKRDHSIPSLAGVAREIFKREVSNAVEI